MIRFTIDGEKHEFDDDKIFNHELIAIKRVTEEKLDLVGFLTGIQAKDTEALTALVWISMKRNGSDIKFSDVEFDVVEFLTSFESDQEPDAEPDPTQSDATPPTSATPSS